ncbi:MAG: class I SAM-dependent methyltransferase [Anaerolineae bacterium]
MQNQNTPAANVYAPPQDYDYLWTQLRDVPYFRGLLRAMESRFYRDLPMRGPVLDLGSGDGLFARQTFAKKLDAGIDPFYSPTYGGITGEAYLSMEIAEGAEMPFKSETFNTVISNSVLEHIPDLEPVIAEVYRVLNPGGYFLFCSPSDHFTDWMIGGKLFGDAYRNWFNKISRHHHTDSPAVWTERLNRHGLEVERIWYYFSPKATQTLELGHYFGLPNLITRKLFGKWVMWPSRSNPFLRFLDATLRPIYNEPLPAVGSMVFCVARKPAKICLGG